MPTCLHSQEGNGSSNVSNEPQRIFLEGYKDRVKVFFGGRSLSYDVENDFHPPLCTFLVNIAQPFAGASLLDVCTGTGYVAVYASEKVGSSGRVLGVDISESMLGQVQGCLKASVKR